METCARLLTDEYKIKAQGRCLSFGHKGKAGTTNVRSEYFQKVTYGVEMLLFVINPLKTKRRLLYLKIQFVPRSKHFSSRL